MAELTVSFTATLWLYQGKGAWHFVTLPEEDAARIRLLTTDRQHGWGSLRVTASIGGTHWQTSIFPDSKSDSYLLPVKAEVRKKERLAPGDTISVEIEIS